MSDYNFLNLSPFEFENLSRDLLQKKLGTYIESFTSGRDSGIDLRISQNQKNIIVQAKRYGKYSDLKSNLKKEVKNLKNLKPAKYILTTSVGLTPQNKEEIKKIFEPFILSTEDIIGKNDLNNLLGLYPEIEKKFYKLWLSSIEILNKVIHSKVYNQSEFELEEIKEALKIYVQNESFNEALEILKENHYVIISGIPGIGKTTLARMLVYHLLAKDFDEFVYLSESVNEGVSFFHDSKKQVLFFDDFLGKNFLETKLGFNEESRIVKLINKVKSTKNKLFILTTREYILNQAKSTYEIFNNHTVNIAKCTLDISKYTRFIKAEILYNHLFFADIPISHLNNLIKSKLYLKLIEHQNYNPRIIETFVQNEFWNKCEPDEFSLKLLSFFNNPESVWLHAFENTISKGAQITLLVLSTLGTPVLFDDLKAAVDSFCIKNKLKYIEPIDSISFQKLIKELESTFIITKIDSRKKIAVEFQNPSIQDFIIQYLSNKNELIHELITSIIYYNQFFTIFTLEKKKKTKKIKLNDKQIKFFTQKLITEITQFKNSTIHRLNYSNSATNRFTWYKYENFTYTFLNQIRLEYLSRKHSEIEELIKTEFQKNIIPKVSSYYERSAYISLLKNIGIKQLEFNNIEIIESFASQLDSLYALDDFIELERVLEEDYKTYTEGETFIERINDIITSEVESVESEDIENLIDNLKDIGSKFQISLDDTIYDLEERHSEYEKEMEEVPETEMDEYKYKEEKYFDKKEHEDKQIENLFESLISE